MIERIAKSVMKSAKKIAACLSTAQHNGEIEYFANITTSAQIAAAFISTAQLKTIVERCNEEPEYGKKLCDIAQQIVSMPVSHEQDGKDDLAVARLHYFADLGDWYITGKVANGSVNQAYGYTILNGGEQKAEYGYISIKEITNLGADLDLFFTPCSLTDIKAERTTKK